MRALNVCSGATTYCLEIIFTSSLNLKMFSCNSTSELKSFAVNEITQSDFKGNFKEIVQQPLLLNISHTTLQYQIRVGTTTETERDSRRCPGYISRIPEPGTWS